MLVVFKAELSDSMSSWLWRCPGGAGQRLSDGTECGACGFLHPWSLVAAGSMFMGVQMFSETLALRCQKCAGQQNLAPSL